MGILLAILKIIGMILLILLVIILFVVLFVLFIPIRYEMEFFSDQSYRIHAKVTWLAHLVRLYFKYEDEFDLKLWILCFPLSLLKEKSKTKIDTQDSTLNEEEHDNTFSKPEKDLDKDSVPDKNIEQESHTKPNKSIKEKKVSLVDKIKNVSHQIIKYKSMLEDSRNQNAFSSLKDQIFLLLKRICPKKLKLNLSYSTGSPDTTAEIFGILAMFPIGYQNRWIIYPDFEAENFYIRGNAIIKGKILGIHLLMAILNIMFDRNCRRLYKQLKN